MINKNKLWEYDIHFENGKIVMKKKKGEKSEN